MGRKKAPSPSFGGSWTNKKLEVLKEYLERYTTALSKQRFRLEYIDAFAGTGYRALKEKEGGPLLFPELAEDDSQRFLEGSARIALRNPRPFDRYVFVEKDSKYSAELEKLKTEFPAQAPKIEIISGDANTFCQRLPKKSWSGRRAVMFLDPFGMQTDWKSIEAIARTKSIDLWVLIPLGIGIVRLMTKTGKMPKSWEDKLNAFFGTTAWKSALYTTHVTRNIFGGDEEEIVRAGIDKVAGFLQERLRSCFPGVASNPRPLFNSKSCPLYLLCFAAGRPGRGAEIAVKLAENILGRI